MAKPSTILKSTVAFLFVFLILYFFQNDIFGFISPKPNFNIMAEPDSLVLGYKGSSNGTVITVKSINGLRENITFEVKPGLGVIGIKFTFDSPVVYLPADGQASCTLRLDVVSPIPPGRYYVDVLGSAGNLTRSVHITINVSS